MEEEEVLYNGTSGDPTVVWFDGGGTTGWAVISVHPDALLDPEIMISNNITYFACGEFWGNEFMQVDQMVALTETWPGAAIGVEHWVLYDSSAGRKDENLTSAVRINAAFRYGLHLRQIERDIWTGIGLRSEVLRRGVPKLLGDDGMVLRHEVPQVHRQNAALGVHSVKDSVVQRVFYSGKSLYDRSTGSTHARDATKHTLTFLKRIKGNPRLRAEAFPALTPTADA